MWVDPIWFYYKAVDVRLMFNLLYQLRLRIRPIGWVVLRMSSHVDVCDVGYKKYINNCIFLPWSCDVDKHWKVVGWFRMVYGEIIFSAMFKSSWPFDWISSWTGSRRQIRHSCRVGLCGWSSDAAGFRWHRDRGRLVNTCIFIMGEGGGSDLRWQLMWQFWLLVSRLSQYQLSHWFLLSVKFKNG